MKRQPSMPQNTWPCDLERPTAPHDQHAIHLALLYDISRTLIASGDLHDLLTRLLDRTIEALGATRGSIMVLNHNPNGEGYVIRAGAGVESAPSDISRVLREGVASKAIADRQTIVIDDVRADPRWVTSVIDQRPLAPRSAMVVPLIHKEDVIGVLTLLHVEPSYFDYTAVELINAVAAQAAMAIERASAYEQAQRRAEELARLNRERDILYAQERQRRSELATLYDSALDIATGADLKDVLTRVAERAAHLVDADGACVFLVNDAQNELILSASYNLAEAYQGERVRFGEDLVGRVALNAEVMSVGDYLNWEGRLEVFATSMFRAMTAVPLICNDRVIGVLSVSNTTPGKTFSEQHVRLLQMLGTQAAVAVENSQLLANLQRSNAELVRANRLKSEFLALVSHELRTPMNSITGYTEMLNEGFYGALSPDILEPIQRVQRNAHHLLKLINDVLDLSMIEADRLHLACMPFDLGAVVNELCETAAAQICDSDVVLFREIPPDLPLMYGDARRVRQVVNHLIANAIKFTECGHIRVRVTLVTAPIIADEPAVEAGAMVCIEVADTGIGIPAAFQQMIFDAFRQVDGSATRRYGGIGIGLAIVYRLVALMGGRVELQSQVEVGSTFRVFLPLPAVCAEAEDDRQ